MFVSPLDVGSLRSDNPMQSSYWAALKSAHGWKSHAYRLGHSTLLVLSRTFFHAITIAYVPFGPEEKVSLQDLSLSLKPFLPPSTIFIRYDLPFGSMTGDLGVIAQEESVQPEATVRIDLRSGYASVASAYRERAKRALRKSRDLVSVSLWDGEERDFSLWYDIYLGTARRDGFSPRGREYLSHVLSLERGGVKARLFLARRDGAIVGGTILLLSPVEAIYLFGASKRMEDCTCSHALQDAMIQRAIEEGCAVYDLFGISAPTGRGEHLSSLDLFKTSFGGRVVVRPPSLDFPYRKALYRLYGKLEERRYRKARAH